MKMPRFALVILGFAFGLMAASLAHAASLEETEATLADVRATLAKSNAKAEDIQSALTAALKAQSDLSAKSVELGASLKSQQAATAATAKKIEDQQKRIVILASDLAARKEELSGLLVGLLHLQSDPPPALLVSPDDVMEAVRGATVFGVVVPDIEAKAQDVKNRLTELRKLQDDTVAEKAKQQQALAALAASQQELTKLQADQQELIAATRADLANEQQAALSLAAKSKDLEQLMAELRQMKADAEARKSAQALAVQAAAVKAEQERLEKLKAPLRSLPDLKGHLVYPVAGDIILHYGDATSLGTNLQGLAFATAPQAIVNAPVDGKVEFAGPFRSYGQLLILDAGEGYLVLLAGMNRISAQMGQTVRIGEPLGEMGLGPSNLPLLGAAASQNRPVFYVEFRKGNAAVDSTPWWQESKKEAMQ